MDKFDKIITAMIEYYSGDAKRIQHFIKVYTFAKAICKCENVDDYTSDITLTAALVHDIGIKSAEEKYNSSSGKYQEMLGPDIADKLLSELGIDEKIISRVHFLIAHHHTYNNINSLDYQILVEADFLVNAYEDSLDKKSILSIREKIFKTMTGIKFLNDMYKLTD